MSQLFDAVKIGSLELKNRVVMAPMTRGRAQADGTPNPIMATYYEQRASAGLIITEATSISQQGVGWVNAPGMFSDAHEEAWKPVTEAVHAQGGKIVLQLWHMGRVSHPDFQEGNGLPVGPSAIAAKGESTTSEGKKPYVTPRALEAEELAGVAQDYANAARRAIAAGFDGVEIHAANGYLLDQFIRDGSNQRTDSYGGSIENRWRFPLEVVDAVVAAVGADRTGIRFSPTGPYNDMSDSSPIETFKYGAEQCSERGLMFIHVIDPVPGHMMGNPDAPKVGPHMREAFNGSYLINGGYMKDTANQVLESNAADAVAFGAIFISNPDLVARFQQDAELSPPSFETFYTPGPEGYTDYPNLNS